MKKTLSLFLVILSVRAFACGGYGDLYPKWSIGVIGFGNQNMPISGYRPYFLPGIQFTHASGNGLWNQRAAIEYTKFDVLTPAIYLGSGGADILYMDGTEKRSLLRLGIERGYYIRSWFRPYAAIDLAGQVMKSDVYYSGGLAGLNQRDEISTKGIGLLPAIGFKTNIGKRISVYAEYRVEAFLNDVDTKTTDYWGNVDYRPTSETKFDFAAGKIVQAGIQVMF